MGWSFRKSKSFGPFRVNFSNSGVGLSFGVKGARVSVSKRGTYVNLGVNGIYYRQRIDRSTPDINDITPTHDPPSVGPDIPHTVTTRDVENITDVDSRSFVDELQRKASKVSFFKFFGLGLSVIVFLYAFSFANDVVRREVRYQDVFKIKERRVHVRSQPSKDSRSLRLVKRLDQLVIVSPDTASWVKVYLDNGTTGFIRTDMGNVDRVLASSVDITRIEEFPMLKFLYVILVVLLTVWCAFVYRVDVRRKTLEIYYTLDGEIAILHEKFLEYFREVSASSRVWQTLHVTRVSDAKYHAGASQLVSRIPVRGIYPNKLPSQFLKTNVTIPCIVLKDTELYFFPERIIVKRGNKFGAAFYRSIEISRADIQFIESCSLAHDATVIDHTWKYPNKHGGPDRRFSDNRQLPICRYSEYTFQSDNGLLEVITTSKVGAMDNFSRFIALIADYQKRLKL